MSYSHWTGSNTLISVATAEPLATFAAEIPAAVRQVDVVNLHTAVQFPSTGFSGVVVELFRASGDTQPFQVVTIDYAASENIGTSLQITDEPQVLIEVTNADTVATADDGGPGIFLWWRGHYELGREKSSA